MPLSNYKDLTVWQKTRIFVKTIYQATSSFPKNELYGLTSQIRRASISIGANIAEGYARASRKEYIQFLMIAYASATETEALLLLATDLGYIKEESSEELIRDLNELIRMLYSMKEALKEKSAA